MEKELNFTSTYYLREDRVWGGDLENGSFYGMVGDVSRGTMDLLGASLTLKVGRARGVAYLHPIGTETYALFIPSTERYIIEKTFFHKREGL